MDKAYSARRFSTDFNSVNRYLANPELTEVLKSLVTLSSLPVKLVETNFAVDSSGFLASSFVCWHNQKYGCETDNSTWVKSFGSR